MSVSGRIWPSFGHCKRPVYSLSVNNVTLNGRIWPLSGHCKRPIYSLSVNNVSLNNEIGKKRKDCHL